MHVFYSWQVWKDYTLSCDIPIQPVYTVCNEYRVYSRGGWGWFWVTRCHIWNILQMFGSQFNVTSVIGCVLHTDYGTFQHFSTFLLKQLSKISTYSIFPLSKKHWCACVRLEIIVTCGKVILYIYCMLYCSLQTYKTLNRSTLCIFCRSQALSMFILVFFWYIL